MKTSANKITEYIAAAFTLLWVYTAVSKLVAFGDFKAALANQVFSHDMANVLAFAIPGVELLVALSLCFTRTRLIGLALSTFLMTVFTGYTALVLGGFYDKIPCTCGGVLNSMGWQTHLYFNIGWWVLGILSLVTSYRYRQGTS